MTGAQVRVVTSEHGLLSEYHYLGTRKPNKRVYTAIKRRGVICFFCRSSRLSNVIDNSVLLATTLLSCISDCGRLWQWLAQVPIRVRPGWARIHLHARTARIPRPLARAATTYHKCARHVVATVDLATTDDDLPDDGVTDDDGGRRTSRHAVSGVRAQACSASGCTTTQRIRATRRIINQKDGTKPIRANSRAMKKTLIGFANASERWKLPWVTAVH